jgi:hypothetical protein
MKTGAAASDSRCVRTEFHCTIDSPNEKQEQLERAMPTVLEACKASFEANKGDCSGFARSVAGLLGVPLAGLADDIVNTLRGGGNWVALADGVAAAASAATGAFVLAGLRGDEQAKPDAHGHVVVVTGPPLAHDAYPTAWWGSLGGTPGQGQTLNYAWTVDDRDKVSYAVWNAA